MLQILLIGILFLGCKTERDVETSNYKEYVVENTQVFLSLENSPFLGRPTSLKAVTDGLLIVDTGYLQIIKVDDEGNRLFSFGKRGRGPGEFQSITGLWLVENGYLVYDYNSFKFLTFNYTGKLTNEKVLDQNPANPGSKYSIPITLYALSSNKLLIPTGGRKGHLFAIADLNSGEMEYAGHAVSQHKDGYQNKEVLQAYSRGEISEGLLNLVMLSGNSSAIYSFQQTTGVLEKYTHEGVQVWEYEMNLPVQKNLFEQIAVHNREVGSINVGRLYVYSRAMETHNGGVALLLNVPEDYPLTIAWVPEDGSEMQMVIVEGITMDSDGFLEGFTISPDGKQAYFLKQSSGTIYQFDWPL